MPGFIINLLMFVKNFGKVDGLLLAYKFKFDLISRLRLPGIKSDIFLRKKTTDKATFFQIFLKRQYNIRFPLIPEIVIDAGANIGLFTVMIKNKFPNAKVISVEPDPDNFKLLQKNTAFYDNVFCLNSGLWSNDTFLNVYDKFQKGKSAVIVEENSEGIIKGVSIESLMTKYDINTIDLLKLDVETSEKQIFSENFHSWLSRTKIIMIELHDELDKGCSRSFFKAINISMNNYTFSNCGQTVIIFNNDLI